MFEVVIVVVSLAIFFLTIYALIQAPVTMENQPGCRPVVPAARTCVVSLTCRQAIRRLWHSCAGPGLRAIEAVEVVES